MSKRRAKSDAPETPQNAAEPAGLHWRRLAAYVDREAAQSDAWVACRHARIALLTRQHTIALMMVRGATRDEAVFDLDLMTEVEGPVSQQMSLRSMTFEQLGRLRAQELEGGGFPTPNIAVAHDSLLKSFTAIRNTDGADVTETQDPDGVRMTIYASLDDT